MISIKTMIMMTLQKWVQQWQSRESIRVSGKKASMIRSTRRTQLVSKEFTCPSSQTDMKKIGKKETRRFSFCRLFMGLPYLCYHLFNERYYTVVHQHEHYIYVTVTALSAAEHRSDDIRCTALPADSVLPVALLSWLAPSKLCRSKLPEEIR